MKWMKKITEGFVSFARTSAGVARRFVKLTWATASALLDSAKSFVSKKQKQLSEITIVQCTKDVALTAAGWIILFAVSFAQSFCMSLFGRDLDLTNAIKHGISYAFGSVKSPIKNGVDKLMKGKSVSTVAKEYVADKVTTFWWGRKVHGDILTVV